jgi:hypothetical protein
LLEPLGGSVVVKQSARILSNFEFEQLGGSLVVKQIARILSIFKFE